jgi:hypothetical protein
MDSVTKKFIVGRHINGLTINGGREYLLDEAGGIMEFDNKQAAVDYLFSKGMPFMLIHSGYFSFEEAE